MKLAKSIAKRTLYSVGRMCRETGLSKKNIKLIK